MLKSENDGAVGERYDWEMETSAEPIEISAPGGKHILFSLAKSLNLFSKTVDHSPPTPG